MPRNAEAYMEALYLNKLRLVAYSGPVVSYKILRTFLRSLSHLAKTKHSEKLHVHKNFHFLF